MPNETASIAHQPVRTADRTVVPHWIDGEALRDSDHSRVLPVYNPSCGDQIASVIPAGPQLVAQAMAAAVRAARTWGHESALRRSRVLFRFKQLLEDETDALAALIAREHGKTIADARGEVTRGLEVVEFACGAPQLLKGEFSDNIARGVDSASLREPLGVTVGITPFNFPVMVPLWMAPMAIACGNAFVLKPSEKDPSPSIRLAELWREAGLPAGVFSVLQGDRATVDALLTHPDVQAISFVGSTPVAKSIHEIGTRAGKRVQALGGAKNHMVVMPDAPVDKVADALVGAAFGSAGERCMAISVVVPVGEETAAQLRIALLERIAGLRIGASDDPNADMGPVVTAEHLQRVATYIDAGCGEGAELVVDGRASVPSHLSRGFYLGPTLFDHVTPAMRIYQEEIFGPVLSIVRSDSLDEALELVNTHRFANGVAVFTQDGRTARDFSRRARVGMVGVNVPIPVPMAFHSFGGWRESLFGDHHVHGLEGVRFYTRLKCVTQRWFEEAPVSTFTMPTWK